MVKNFEFNENASKFANLIVYAFRYCGCLCFFLLCILIVYEQSAYQLTEKIENLREHIKTHQMLKLIALEEKERLNLQLQSQNDPYWCELVLMSSMGLCPENYTKIYFKQRTND